jgi:UDP-N-acetylmuramoyl-tripeptide--D-alanyl-D-alanine ligase
VNLPALVQALGGELHGKPLSRWTLGGLATDTRTLAPGDLFVALRGEHFDGNDFIDDAIARGASVVVCARGRALARDGVPFVEVPDTLRALGDIAATHRRLFNLPLVAITGSNGKTTTKELLRSVLAVAFGAERVLANPGNLNNLIGLPLTLVKLEPSHHAAVLEMGMNAPGEIARLTDIAMPTVGLITSVGAAHLEGLGSIEGVAQAKGELYEGLSKNAVAVVNLDDPWVVRMAERFGGRKLGFGRNGDVRADCVEPLAIDRTRFHLVCDRGTALVEIPLGGRHNVSNALAAATAALAIDVEFGAIAEGLRLATPPPMRMSVERLANGVSLVNDSYNANPSSLKAALDAMADLAPERLIIVLGEMLELGPRAAELHATAGADVAATRPVLLCSMGRHAADVNTGAASAGLHPENIVVAQTHDDAAEAVACAWRKDDVVLVKGSRGSQMERVVEALRRRVGV